ncbi:MAG: undecaprenyl-diphosphate phosphatase, partial [Tepidisphaeraceae bacterium]
MSDLLKAIILGIVEGLTEFIPVSSTGHLLLCEQSMGVSLADDRFWKTFAIFIQIGAIAAVVVYFRDRMAQVVLGKPLKRRREVVLAGATPLEIATAVHAASGTGSATGRDDVASDTEDELAMMRRGHMLAMIALATVPVLVVGFVAHEWVEKYLETPRVIAMALGIGGIAMALIEWFKPNLTTRDMTHITWKQALGIGCVQVLAAVFPGTSRSAATIMGGLLAGLSRPAAAEFSFFLAVPAMGAACAFSLLKWLRDAGGVAAQEVLLLTIGTLVSFLVAWAVIG